jgi:hypothetical protein
VSRFCFPPPWSVDGFYSLICRTVDFNRILDLFIVGKSIVPIFKGSEKERADPGLFGENKFRSV